MRNQGRAAGRMAPMEDFASMQVSSRVDLYRIFMAGKRRSLTQVEAASMADSDSFTERESISIKGATGR